MKFRHWLGLTGVVAAMSSIFVHLFYGWAFAMMCIGVAGLCIAFASLMVPNSDEEA
jgi:hypothetical protein